MAADQLLERVVSGGLIAPPAPVVAMLSGGRDSVCMLDLAVRARDPEAVAALHVNYGLRDDSDEDERHCAELCERLGVEVTTERPQRPEGPGNLQAWARDCRYAAAARLALPLDATIVTGHSADDQVETILYRLASSPSRRALLGMRPQDGSLARPLLGTTRAEITEYCEERGLRWREDSSNAEQTYARNRIRSGLLPELAKAHPAASANVLRTAELLREEAEVLDAIVAAEVDGSGERPAARSPSSACRAAPGAAPPRRSGARRWRRRAAGAGRGTLRRAGDGAAPHRLAMLDLGGGVRAVVERGVLRAERP